MNGLEPNELIDRLPPHLKQFIVPQIYEEYSSIDQAVWRYVMRKNTNFLSSAAHKSYITGLKKTGIFVEKIPRINEMNEILKEIGWATVAVDGFIPPNAFMEFQAYKVLVIATDIRQLENIEYTPAPDIIHEAAGHAPIIANPDYAEYLRRLGEVGAKAILSKYDVDLFEAVRELSILKEADGSSDAEIEKATKEVERLQAMQNEFSEMAKIRNLQWWSVEYGLIGETSDPKIYGAGLLSSIGESKWCMQDKVAKIPYSIETSEVGFDITKPQPQLFVTPNFAYLMEVLEEFANTLSFRRGGYKGLKKLIESGMIGTIELSSGLQISGRFIRMICNDDNKVIFVQSEGPTALAHREFELIGHGISTHVHGFSSPLGKLKNTNLALEDMGPVDLRAYDIYVGSKVSLQFESGFLVEGIIITGVRNAKGKLLLLQMNDCTVTYKDEILYKPEYGPFDLAIGNEIISAYAGPADYNSFPVKEQIYKTKTHKTKKSDTRIALETLYQQVRDMRSRDSFDVNALDKIFKELTRDHYGDWLLTLEMLEFETSENLREEMMSYLNEIIENNPELENLIKDGLSLLELDQVQKV